jgi:hypothetical protein
MSHAFTWKNGRRRKTGAPRAEPLAAAVMHEGLWLISTRRRAEVYDAILDRDQERPLQLDAERSAALHALLRDRERWHHPPDLRPQDQELEDDLRALGYL